MTTIERAVSDRNALLAMVVGGDHWATAALERGDDLALLRRITKAGLTEALPLAIERACMRGEGMLKMARAAGLTVDELRSHIATIYARQS